MKKDPLSEALSIGRSDRLHFDWPDAQSVMTKVVEEMNELSEALNLDRFNQAHELGDLLFTLVQLSRHLKLDPGLALEIANQRYLSRVSEMKSIIHSNNLKFENLTSDELESFWKKAKLVLKKEERLTLKTIFNFKFSVFLFFLIFVQ